MILSPSAQRRQSRAVVPEHRPDAGWAAAVAVDGTGFGNPVEGHRCTGASDSKMRSPCTASRPTQHKLDADDAGSPAERRHAEGIDECRPRQGHDDVHVYGGRRADGDRSVAGRRVRSAGGTVGDRHRHELLVDVAIDDRRCPVRLRSGVNNPDCQFTSVPRAPSRSARLPSRAGLRYGRRSQVTNADGQSRHERERRGEVHLR